MGSPAGPGAVNLVGGTHSLSCASIRRESFRTFRELSEIFSDDNNYSLSRELLVKVGGSFSTGRRRQNTRVRQETSHACSAPVRRIRWLGDLWPTPPQQQLATQPYP